MKSEILKIQKELDPRKYRELYAAFQNKAAQKLKDFFLKYSAPSLSITLGSGLKGLVEEVNIQGELSFESVGLPSVSADGHDGVFYLGEFAGHTVILQSGRLHTYENWSGAIAALPARVQALAGVRNFVITNAAGSFADEHDIGDVVILTGNRGLLAPSSAAGLYDSKEFVGPFGAKFFATNSVYDKELVAMALQVLSDCGERAHYGVYAFMPGPRYEEPNEIRSFIRERKQAIDEGFPEHALAVVGMSTVPEVHALAQLKTNPQFSTLRTLGVSIVTNKASGIGGSVPTHEEVIEAGPRGGIKVITMLRKLLNNGESSNCSIFSV